MTAPLVMFAASFLFVALKAGQQRNVAFNHWKLVPVFSFAMAFTEVYIIAAIATQGFSFGAVIGMGAGGATGALLAMFLHERYLGESSGRQTHSNT